MTYLAGHTSQCCNYCGTVTDNGATLAAVATKDIPYDVFKCINYNEGVLVVWDPLMHPALAKITFEDLDLCKKVGASLHTKFWLGVSDSYQHYTERLLFEQFKTTATKPVLSIKSISQRKIKML